MKPSYYELFHLTVKSKYLLPSFCLIEYMIGTIAQAHVCVCVYLCERGYIHVYTYGFE